jgi:hypothetical protein
MPKTSIALSNLVYADLQSWVNSYGGNHGTVCEAALMRFRDVADSERRQLVKRIAASKQARGRTGWIGLFWDAYAEEFGKANFDPANERYLMSLRKYAGFDCIMLQLPHEVEGDPRGFEIHVTESPPSVAGMEHITHRFRFTLDDSPFSAAAAVAACATQLRAERERVTNPPPEVDRSESRTNAK